VPATDEQLATLGGDTDRYDAELRPELMRRAIEDIQNAWIEVDVWKIEGVDESQDAAMLARQTRSGEGREGVALRAARARRVDREGRAVARGAAPVDGFIGFAIGRSIWWMR
jgi:5-dehydro-2-deoxygluconokinase